MTSIKQVQTNIFQGAEMIASPMSGFANIYHHIIVPYSVRLKELQSLQWSCWFLLATEVDEILLIQD